MKKIMIFAAVAAMFIFASCQKEEMIPVQDSQAGELVFTATIDQSATKTTINTDGTSADKGKVSWVVNDEISVTDNTNTAVYYIKEASDIAADGSATFTYKSGDRPSSTASSYTATYGNAITTAQTYSATADKLPMTGTSDSGNKTKLNFSVTCGLLKLNLTASGGSTSSKDISKIEIVGTPTGGSASVYTLTCDNVSIASAKDFYIALPAGDYTLMKFINSKGCVCFKKAKTAMAIEANKIQPVTLSGITFSALLPGKFTVSASKQVQFTAANLYWGGSYYAFETAQTAYPKTWDANHVGHFFWTNLTDYQSGNASYMPYASSYSYSAQSESDKFWCGEDNKLTVDGQSGLYALMGFDGLDDYGECYYLFNCRDNCTNRFKTLVSVTTSEETFENCLIIAPDGYDYSSNPLKSSYTAAEWAVAESDGLVCLPAAGYREGSSMGEDEFGIIGYYWLSTTGDEYDCASIFQLHNGSVPGDNPDTMSSSDRYYGFSLRLVSTVK